MTGPYFATFLAGLTTASFNVTIIADTLLEDDETFQLIIVANKNDKNVMRGEIRRTTVTIINNGKYIHEPW